ncbi:MAG: hypothetical protein GXY70_08010 [Euryarchaeota archaeon]|nr:hypothetical protein [Euryarchaeota archaeon]
MENRSKFKECPKCGLRNKPGATQCDFCGQSLGAADDWQQHVKDLESLNKMELRKPLDDRTSKRIESTIIRKDAPASRNIGIREAVSVGTTLEELPTKEAKDEGTRPAPASNSLRIKESRSAALVEDREERPQESKGPTIAEILREPAREAPVHEETSPLVKNEPSPEPIIEESAAPESPLETAEDEEGTEAEAPSEDMVCGTPLGSEGIPVVQETVEEVVPANEVTLTVEQFNEEVPVEESISDTPSEVEAPSSAYREEMGPDRKAGGRSLAMVVGSLVHPPGTAAIAVLALGSVAYLAVLSLTAIGVLGTVPGLGGGAVGSLMIIYGASAVYPTLRKKDDNEVFICPKCHEKVDRTSGRCPACGTEFTSDE